MLALVGSVTPLSPLRERVRERGTRCRSSVTPTPTLPRRGGGRKASGCLLTLPGREALGLHLRERRALNGLLIRAVPGTKASREYPRWTRKQRTCEESLDALHEPETGG
jgi:hypothetical protein